MIVSNRADSKMGINCRNPANVFLCSVLFVSYSLALLGHAANTIKQDQVIRDGETVISAGQIFALGFFSPENSTFRYVGIWYYNALVDSVVWVANRANPISGRRAVLTLGNNGNLMILDEIGSLVWSSNASLVTNKSSAILMDSGNLMLSRSEDVGDAYKAYWQSFENPTDNFLPGMRISLNPQNIGEKRVFTSWETASDPSPGRYSMGIDSRGSLQVVIWEQSNRRWRSGHWNGLIFMGVPSMRARLIYGFKLFIDEETGNLYFTYASNSSLTLRFWLRWDGYEEQLSWNEGTRKWNVLQSEPNNDCEVYNKCGNFGSCNMSDSPKCSCIDGFEPRYTDQWNKGNWSGGCVRRTQLQCQRNSSSVNKGGEDGFLEVDGVKLPDFADRVEAQDSSTCGDECLKNCSCNAYAFVSGIGCMIWNGDLVDIQQFAGGGEMLHIRLAGSELGGKSKITNVEIITIVVGGAIFLSIFIWLLWRFKVDVDAFSNSMPKSTSKSISDLIGSKELSKEFSGPNDIVGEGKQGSGTELPIFNFGAIEIATNYFSDGNKLGQGGFGPVYKGRLPGGEQIAVKRLSKWSGQGLEEFKNEIILIAKLQHRNLVRLLGCCIEGDEKMLIYEYMSNKSLDSFLFDQAKQALLDWKTRFTVIEGIARGLLYLHRDSRLRIIHRDLKASNILLDEEMTPKISDFGMARIFGGNQNEANTNRVVGTYGYMSPEYAMEGLFSVKSDVYSFGVLLLEIVSGRRNSSFYSHDHSSLIGYAWHLWSEGRVMEFVDSSLRGSCSQSEVMRCMHVGMLCVQDTATNRPTMPSVLLMLESETVTFPIPRQPTLTSMRGSVDMDSGLGGRDTSSNDVSITGMVGR